jgi:hypothetical protein
MHPPQLHCVFLSLILVLTGLACSDEPIEQSSTNMLPGTGGQGGGTEPGDNCIFEGMQYGLGDTRCDAGEQYQCSGLGLWASIGASPACELTIDRCDEARQTNSYIGCDYWPVDLDNAVEVAGLPIDGGCGDQEGLVLRSDLSVCVTNGQGRGEAGLCDAGQCPDGYTCNITPVCVLDAQSSRFTVVVANPSDVSPANVTLLDPTGQSTTITVGPSDVASVVPQAQGWPDVSIDGTSQNRSAYRLTSDSPIVAYQFNPLDNEFVFSNDGSLLLPAHTYQNDYFVMTFPTLDRRPAEHSYHGYFSVVASEEGQTRVRITTAADVLPGTVMSGLPARTPTEFTLNQFDVLHLEAAGAGDLTGSRVEVLDPGKAVGVFVGHEAALITNITPEFRGCQNNGNCGADEICGRLGVCTRQCSNDGQCGAGFYCRAELGECFPGVCCADHIEEQLFPSETWGSRFVLSRTQPRADRTRNGAAGPDFVRILARSEGTTITITPPISNACGVLGAGSYCDLFIDQDVSITASEPILVGHFLTSTDGQKGDPALAFAVPVEQFRSDYTFLTPQEYDEDYVSVVASSGAAVTLDGVDISGQLSPIDADYVGGAIQVQPGQHALLCPTKCSVLVYGYSTAVSYLFAGGLDLELISEF